MAEFKLARKADNKLVGIYGFTLVKFGQYQADAYVAGFEKTFSLLADYPRMGVEVNQFRAGLRRFRFQSHFIFYTEEEFGVLIRDVLHTSQSVRRELFD